MPLLRCILLLCLLLCLLAPASCTTGPGFVNADGDLSPDATPSHDKGLTDATDDLIWDSTVGPPVTLTLATYNVKNFFDEQDDPSHADDVPAAADVQSKVEKLGAALRQLEADVVALQEVENRPLLERLNQEELGSLGYEYVRLIEGNDIRGIDVALLSRFPVTRAESHIKDVFLGVDGDTKTYGFSRDCLEATVEPSPGRELILLINHLRANNWSEIEESIARRQAQANRVRKIADEILSKHPDANLAVLGDLNDTPDSRTLELIMQGTPELFDLVTLVPSAERYTFKTDKTQLDYILVAPGLKADLVSGTVQVAHGPVFEQASDHFPVTARFTLE